MTEQEKIISALVGRRLTAVAYLSLDAKGYQRTLNGPGGDSVDFGVDLDFDGHPLSVGWIPPTKDTEGLQVTPEALLGWRDLHAYRIEVGVSSKWAPALGTQLSAAHLDWRPWSSRASTSYLVGVHLSFANEHKITLALAEIVDGQIVRSATNVAVIFDDATVP